MFSEWLSIDPRTQNTFQHLKNSDKCLAFRNSVYFSDLLGHRLFFKNSELWIFSDLLRLGLGFFNLEKLRVGYGVFLVILELGVFLGPAETDYFSRFQDLKYFWASKNRKSFRQFRTWRIFVWASALCIRLYNNLAPVIRSMQFHYCTVSNPGTGADDAFCFEALRVA